MLQVNSGIIINSMTNVYSYLVKITFNSVIISIYKLSIRWYKNENNRGNEKKMEEMSMHD